MRGDAPSGERSPVGEEPSAPRDGAKALLLTVLGEFVLRSGGSAWTSSLVAAADELGIGEKNARQALARTREQGLISGDRHGRLVRWSLTPAGRELLEAGTRRIYGFGDVDRGWGGTWLVAHCPIAESQRTVRNRLRTQLAFLGFGELSPSLLISPHVDRESELRAVLHDLGLLTDCVLMRSDVVSGSDVVGRAWDLDGLALAYGEFVDAYDAVDPADGPASFRAVVDLVHEWRRFPSLDPELPAVLLPDGWVGARAAELFRSRHAAWSPSARAWFDELESEHALAG